MCRFYKALFLFFVAVAFAAPGAAGAQEFDPYADQGQYTDQAQYMEPAEYQEQAPPQPQVQAPAYASQELQQLVAPVALYPDQLLGQVLMASAYPLEVVEAKRWLAQNPSLAGDALTDALEAQNWDPSVKALTAFPQVLSMMDGNLEWTEKLGEAFMANQAGVMDAVQQLRVRAQEANRLPPPDQMAVGTDNGYITIAPVQPDSVNVPWYNPAVVFAPWPYPNYAPYYFPAPYSSYCYYGACWYSFAPPVTVYYSWWGWDRISWRHHHVHIDTHRWRALSGNRPVPAGNVWQFDPAHRHGVPYVNPTVRQRFQATSTATVRENRGFTAGTSIQGGATFSTTPRSHHGSISGTSGERSSWQEQAGGHRPTPESVRTPRPEIAPQEELQPQQHYLSVTPAPQDHHHQSRQERMPQIIQPEPQAEPAPQPMEAPMSVMHGNHAQRTVNMPIEPREQPRIEPQRVAPPLFETMPSGNVGHGGANRSDFGGHQHSSPAPQVRAPIPMPAPAPAAPQNSYHDGGDHHGH